MQINGICWGGGGGKWHAGIRRDTVWILWRQTKDLLIAKCFLLKRNLLFSPRRRLRFVGWRTSDWLTPCTNYYSPRRRGDAKQFWSTKKVAERYVSFDVLIYSTHVDRSLMRGTREWDWDWDNVHSFHPTAGNTPCRLLWVWQKKKTTILYYCPDLSSSYSSLDNNLQLLCRYSWHCIKVSHW